MTVLTPQNLYELVSFKAAHNFAWGTYIGVSLWVSFIGGIIMFKTLPRHMFGNLQSKLFPAYFTLQSVLLSFMIGSYVYAQHLVIFPNTIFGKNTYADRLLRFDYQQIESWSLVFLVLAYMMTLLNFLVVGPMTSAIMKARHKEERNSGKEAYGPRELLTPKLVQLNKQFGIAHGISSIANLSAFILVLLHGLVISSDITL